MITELEKRELQDGVKLALRMLNQVFQMIDNLQAELQKIDAKFKIVESFEHE
jgi:hypothetical protein